SKKGGGGIWKNVLFTRFSFRQKDFPGLRNPKIANQLTS
ncbi:MAG: hypothetical protein ACI90V_008271, partial [Bacillariaceae sp.]